MSPIKGVIDILRDVHTMMYGKLAPVCNFNIKVKGVSLLHNISYTFKIILHLQIFTENKTHVSTRKDTHRQLNIS